jgi:hypothetical protein
MPDRPYSRSGHFGEAKYVLSLPGLALMTIKPAEQAIYRVATPARGSIIDGFGSDRRRSQRFPCKSTLAVKRRCIVDIVLRVLSVALSDVGAGTVNF